MFRFHAESYHGDLSPMLGGVVPPSNSRARLPNGGGDIQLTPVQLVQQLGRTTLTLGEIIETGRRRIRVLDDARLAEMIDDNGAHLL